MHYVCYLLFILFVDSLFTQNILDSSSNARAIHLNFTIPTAGMVHGLSGYFETCLYGDIRLSILPETQSKGMFSWFPLYFPFRVCLSRHSNKTYTLMA